MDYIEKKIMNLRIKMHQLINEKGDLLDPEVLEISQMLDVLLIKYHSEDNSNKIKSN